MTATSQVRGRGVVWPVCTSVMFADDGALLTRCLAALKVYPLGIPVMYAAILWRKRDLLNPRIHAVAMSEPDQSEETAITAQSGGEAGVFSREFGTASKGQAKTDLSPQELKELEERVNARMEHPELTPSLFLWRDFGEGLEFHQNPHPLVHI